jgi:glycerol-3-phosphate dehydrogenase
MNRQALLSRLQNEKFDLCILGGGASGAGCALDAALRGLKVALIEKNDFASGTSSKSTKLIHGGVRYLEQAFKHLDFGQLRQVWHGLQERQILLSNAPHLARPLALLTPVQSRLESIYYAAGLRLYDLFAAARDRLPASRLLNKKETLERIPNLSPRIRGSVLYFDGLLDDARFCLALVQSAVDAGAVAVNYAELTGFDKTAENRLEAAQVRNVMEESTFVIRAKVFLNCTGVFADRVRQMANAGLSSRIRPSKGVHLMLPPWVFGQEEALLIPKTPDGRVLFAIPFQGATLLGTTDEDYPNPDTEPQLESGEVDYLLKTLQPYVAMRLDHSMVRAGFGGLRPLLTAESIRGTKGLLRDHEVEYDATSNLYSLLGGKWTTYRLMAKDAIDAVDMQLQAPRGCLTATHRLTGASGYRPDTWKKIQNEYGWDDNICRRLADTYGGKAAEVAALTCSAPGLADRLHPEFPFIRAQVVYAAEKEMAMSIRDVLARRIRLEICDWAACRKIAPEVGKLLGKTLGWTTEKQANEIDAYCKTMDFWMKKAGVNTGQSLR